MVHFSKLRLTGFKSFTDTTELNILPGLTGVVGPNGCGKSNLVEALRWIMGENSPKKMRGGAMDDVIFAGTGTRPPRNFAEVVLTLDNSKKTAPEAFNGHDTLEISRRIERGMGSDYRINGKIVRAADVRLLFADTATGAHSPAIVSQGRVADLISAKPTDRRMVLEEAAAISGLHSRRKEAEQRLRAGEKNLTRLDDVLSEKENLYESLKKQARQAVRYKKLSDIIRRLEATMMAAEYQKFDHDLTSAKERMEEANGKLNEAKQHLHELNKKRDAAQINQKTIRVELDKAVEIKRATELEKDKLENKLTQLDEKRQSIEQQNTQITNDLEHEKHVLSHAKEKLETLNAEKTELDKHLNNFTSDFDAALNKRDAAKAKFDEANNGLAQRKSAFAAGQTQRRFIQERLTTISQEQETLTQDIGQLGTLLIAEKQKSLDTSQEQAHRQTVSDLEKQVEKLEAQITKNQTDLETSDTDLKTAQDDLEQAVTHVTKLQTESDALDAMIGRDVQAQEFTTVMDGLKVEAGYEVALSLALGTDLQAGLDDSAPLYWTNRLNAASLSKLPEGVKTLGAFVDAPKAMAGLLSQIGLVDDAAQGEKLSTSLSAGQILVTTDGHAWRWDGLTIKPEAAPILKNDTTQERLKQRNRLDALKVELKTAQDDLSLIKGKYEAHRTSKEKAENDLSTARQDLSARYSDLNTARETLTTHMQASVENQTTIKALEEKIKHLEQRKAQSAEQVSTLDIQLNNLPDLASDEHAINTLATSLIALEETYQGTQEEYLTLKNSLEQKKNRSQNIEVELEEWQTRQTNATKRVDLLNKRFTDTSETLKTLNTAPEELTQMLESLTQKLNVQIEAVETVQTRVTEIENTVFTLNKDYESYQEDMSVLRENMARDEARFQAATEAKAQLVQRCQQQFSLDPQALIEKFEIGDDDLGEDLQTLQNKFERYRKERERIGAVNLRAEEESQTIFAELETITTERHDVMAAIDELRAAISKLNRDARKKMLAAFEEVNTHFQSLFKRLFNGGQAHLELIDAEDPLNAGLEIYASPPGKRMQNLSLLSGGEQSLTATALIFAMFLTTPSPICILDEIDAPLDDANVERLCDLLTDFAAEAGNDTRFLVITHNPITMAHMHRLYGVTMAEKGISKLVSVDLEKHKAEQQEQLEFA